MNKRVFTGVLAVLLFITVFARAGAASYHEGDVEEYVMQQLAAANIPGVSLSIVTSQKEIYSVAFGDVKETSSDLQICALTRTFTTLAIMQLVEKGDINLEDRVLKYIKNPSWDIAYNTTIQELLSYTKPGTHELALADTLEAYNLDAEVDGLPVNTKFNILGQVIETVSGMDYAAYIRENINIPLDMQSTYTIEEAASTPDITLGCRNYFGLPLKDNAEYTEEDYWLGVPSNGLVSNVKDIGKYMQMYLSAGGKVISYNTMETIMGKGEYAGKSIFGTDAYYTMGWTSTEIDGEQVYYCNGSVENYTSAMFIIPSMDIGIIILFNSADALTGQKYTDEIEAGAVSLVMGRTAKAVSSNSYLMEHGAADVIYFLAFVCSIFPLLMMEVWIRWTKDKFSIIRIAADILLHIVVPTSLIFAARRYIAPWEIIKKAMPDLFFVSIVVIGLFYFGLIVKIVAYIIILLRGGREESLEEDTEQYNNSYIAGNTDNIKPVSEEDITGNNQKEKEDKEKKGKKKNKKTEEDKEAKEKKEKLVKRMKSIKEAGKDETGNNNTKENITGEETTIETEENLTSEETAIETEENITGEETAIETEENLTSEGKTTLETKENIAKEREIAPETKENITDAKKIAPETKNIGTTNMPGSRIGISEENTVNVPDRHKTGNNMERAALPKEDIRNRKLPGTETKAGVKTEKARPGSNTNNRPRKFIVTSDSAVPKRDRNSSLPERKRDRNINRGSSKNSPDSRKRVNRSNNGANSSRAAREGSSLNRKNDNLNNKNNAIRDIGRNNKK